MAKYDRRFLIPYLRDVYSMELLLSAQQRRYVALRKQLQEDEEALRQDVEPEPVVPASSHGAALIWLLFLLLCCGSIACGLGTIYMGQSLWLPCIGLLAASLLSILMFSGKWREYKAAKKAYDSYRKALAGYNSRTQERLDIRMEIEHTRREIAAVLRRSNAVRQHRSNLYAVNVIPSHYRSLEAARFLFEYIRTSKADDVDIILQIYAVEEMKKKPEKIDNKEAAAFLRQRMMLANQVMNDTLQRQNYELQMQEIAELDQNREMKHQYLKMIDENLAVSEYFVQHEMKL